MEERSYLIVGGGLAGLSLAYQLQKKTQNIVLIDRGENFSSRIAAGMINPLVFRRMTKSWRVDEFIPYLSSFYSEIEKETGSSFHHPIQIRRLFSSEQEHQFWLQRQESEPFTPYMEPITPEDMQYSGVKNEFGSGRVRSASYVDTGMFLNSLRAYLSDRITIRTEEFDFNDVNERTYKDIRFENLIFCEGYSGVSNPYFNWLPLHQTKGETLIIKSQTIPDDQSVNRKCFVLPLGGARFKIGSTYDWNNSTPEVTENGRRTLLHNLSYLIDEAVEVIGQEAGIRPTTEDRRPLIGTHPTHKHLHIFNGLGTKGYMTAPLLAREFADHLLLGHALHPEVRIDRFQK